MCRMWPDNWPVPRDTHSSRWGLICNSCTEQIQLCHQSRTSRCPPHPHSQWLPSQASGYAECGYAECGCAMETTGMG